MIALRNGGYLNQSMELTAQEFRFKNPDTKGDLIIPIALIGTESKSKTLDNFQKNIALDLPWLDESAANDKTAIVCGASPSLRSRMHLIEGDVLLAIGLPKFLKKLVSSLNIRF